MSPPVPIAGHTVEHRCCRSRAHSSHVSAPGRPRERDVVADGHAGDAGRRPPRPLPRPRGPERPDTRSPRFHRRRSSRSGRRRSLGCGRAPPPVREGRVPGQRRSVGRRSARGPRRAPSRGRSLLPLQDAELLDRDVAPHEVAVLDLDERRLAAPRRWLRASEGSACGRHSPMAGTAALGMSPSSRMRSRPPPSIVGTAESRASVYGWCGPSKTTSAGPSS